MEPYVRMLQFRMTVNRTRKQRFPRADRRKAPVGDPNIKDDDFIVDEENYFCPPAKRPALQNRTETTPPPAVPARPPPRQRKEAEDRHNTYVAPVRVDKRARDEHNEQERSRRRELAVIYELIRSSFSTDDLRHLEPGSAPKSIEKLSYPQVLQVAHSIMLEEVHNIKMFEKTMQDIKFLEKELFKSGLSIPRPACPLLTENYRKVISTVESILRTDKNARNASGLYEMTPSERAAYGDHQLSFVKNRHLHSLSDGYELFPPMEKRSQTNGTRRSTQVSRYSNGINAHAHVNSYHNSRSSAAHSRSSMGATQANSQQSRTSASNDSVASLDDLEDLELHSIGDTYDLFQNPLDDELELDPVDANFELLPDL